MFYYCKILSVLIVTFFLLNQVSAQTRTAQSYFEEGLQLLKASKVNEALTAFQKSVELDAKQPAARANVGTALLLLNRPAEAVTSFREAARLAPNEASFHAGLCQSLSLNKNHAEAISQCQEAVRLGGSSPDNHNSLVAALRTAQKSDDALRAAAAALQKFPDNEILLNAAAEMQIETGNFAEAVNIYENLARLKPAAVLYQIKLAENYLRQERDGDAIAAANKALAIEKHPLAYFFLGRIYFELGQNEEAAAAFQQAVALDDKFAGGYYSLGLSEARRGRLDNAIVALRQAATIAPENFDYNKELGAKLSNAARYEDAVLPLKKAVKINPTDFEAKIGLGAALSESGNYEEAIPILLEVERLKPGNQFVAMFLNVARARQEGKAQIDEMKRFAKENPRSLDVRMQLVQMLTYTRRLTEAEIYFNEVEQLNTKDARVYVTFGTLRSTTGNYEKAAEAYRKVLEIEQNPAAYLGLANYYTRNGQSAEAKKAYAKVLEIKPDSPNIIKLYADLLRDNGKRREALEMYKRSLAMLPTNLPALFNAGILSAKLGDLNAARQYLEILKAVDAQSAKTLQRFLKFQR